MKNTVQQSLKNVTGGIAVGIANIIPGVSGGTMMVILGIFDPLMASISDIFKVHSEDRKGSIFFLFQVLIGAAIGLVGFAKVVDWLFANYATQTFFWFVGLVLFSIPSLLKKELRGHKVSLPYLILGLFIIALVVWLSPGKQDLTVTDFPVVTLGHLLLMVVVGIIGGATMLFPGISGSMVLLIIGQYYLFKSYLANVTAFEMVVLVPLVFIFIGLFLGILISAKLTSYLLSNNRRETMSLILGLIIASAIVLIPVGVPYTAMTIFSALLAFAFGGGVVMVIDRLVD